MFFDSHVVLHVLEGFVHLLELRGILSLKFDVVVSEEYEKLALIKMT